MMKKKTKERIILILLTFGLIGGAFAYFSATADTVSNIFKVFTGEKDESEGLEIVEPSWKEPSQALLPGSYLKKDPSLISKVEYDGYSVIRVRIPKVMSQIKGQTTEQFNEIADICYYESPQIPINTDNEYISEQSEVYGERKGYPIGENNTGTYNSDDYVFLGKLTTHDEFNDYYFGYNGILYSKNRTENLFDHIQIRDFTKLQANGEERIKIHIDIDARLVQSIDEDTGLEYKNVADAWNKVFKKPQTSNEFGAVNNDSYIDETQLQQIKTRDIYQISYNGNNAEQDIIYTQKKVNSSVNIAGNMYSKDGYLFIGWNTKEDGTGISFTPGVPYTDNANLTLYAQWKANEHSVIIDKETGIKTVNGAGDYRFNQPVTISYILSDGYDFNGWMSNDVIIENNQFILPNKDVHILAKAKIHQYGISYDLDGGYVSSNPDTYNIMNDAFILNNPVKNHYDFIGWTGTDLSTMTKTVSVPKGSFGDRNYKANWKELSQWNVTFNTMGKGTAPKEQIVYYRDKIEEPESPATTNYIFKGWYTENTFINKWDFKTHTMPDKDMTLYAKWVEKPFHNIKISGTQAATNINESTEVYIDVEESANITVQIANTAIANATAKDNKVIITGIKNGTTEVTITASETAGYKTTTTTLPVVVSATKVTIDPNGGIFNGSNKPCTFGVDEGTSFVKSYTYSGKVEELTIPYTGFYFIEAWGGKGGNDTKAGGKGGYLKGYAYFTKDQKIYINCGGKGGDKVTAKGGAYNGGGDAGGHGYSGGGGGATTIATTNRGILVNYEDHKDEVLLVAGGGSGGSNNSIGEGGTVLYAYTKDNTTFPGDVINGASTAKLCGVFAQGQHRGPESNKDGGGGGGGWVGGIHGLDEAGNPAGGGASFINTKAGCIAIALIPSNNDGVGKCNITYEQKSVALQIPERPGYVFDGWELTGSGNYTYNDLSGITMFNFEIGKNAKLTAKWKKQ